MTEVDCVTLGRGSICKVPSVMQNTAPVLESVRTGNEPLASLM